MKWHFNSTDPMKKWIDEKPSIHCPLEEIEYTAGRIWRRVELGRYENYVEIARAGESFWQEWGLVRSADEEKLLEPANFNKLTGIWRFPSIRAIVYDPDFWLYVFVSMVYRRDSYFGFHEPVINFFDLEVKKKDLLEYVYRPGVVKELISQFIEHINILYDPFFELTEELSLMHFHDLSNDSCEVCRQNVSETPQIQKSDTVESKDKRKRRRIDFDMEVD